VKLRLFVAIELDDAVRALAAQAAEALTRSGVVGRFELPDKLHVTVAFLGSAPESELPPLVVALRDASQACRPFRLEFDRLGAFPSERRARVLWVGSKQPSAEFASCASGVRDAYVKLGFAFDSDAQPHVTVCRLKELPLKPLPSLAGHAALVVEGLTLFRSLPAGRTTRYEAIERTRFPP
jgi:2'-5' RNA ligase